MSGAVVRWCRVHKCRVVPVLQCRVVPVAVVQDNAGFISAGWFRVRCCRVVPDALVHDGGAGWITAWCVVPVH